MEKIEVPKQWIIRLLEIKKLAEKQLEENGIDPIGKSWVRHLFGYIESAEDYLIQK